jgi:hypothetical protein
MTSACESQYLSNVFSFFYTLRLLGSYISILNVPGAEVHVEYTETKSSQSHVPRESSFFYVGFHFLSSCESIQVPYSQPL